MRRACRIFGMLCCAVYSKWLADVLPVSVQIPIDPTMANGPTKKLIKGQRVRSAHADWVV